MATRADRFVLLGTTEYAHEKEALDFARGVLPDRAPFHARGLVDLLVARTGQLYEIDLLVIGYAALYLVEIKSHPGRIDGDEQGWSWTPPGEDRARFLANPLRLANHKAKVLRSLLEPRLARAGLRMPFVQPLIFLSATDLDNRLSPAGRVAVVGRQGLLPALQFGQFPGAEPRHFGAPINTPTARALERALDEIGLRPRKGQLRVGEYVLGPVLEDGDGERYQDRVAQHERVASLQPRARVYLVPEQRSVEERQRLRRAADREVQLLWSVRGQPHILGSHGYHHDAPLGPTLIFEDFDRGLRLDQFMRRHPELPFGDRVEILRQIGHALGYCHRRGVVHGSLSPAAVLVRVDDGKVQTRLFNFQLGASEQVSPTIHRSSLDENPAGAYQAPELAADPGAMTPASDTFSLGALAYFLFTGQAPARNTTELLQRLAAQGHLDPATVADDVPDAVVDMVQTATKLGLGDRYDDCGEWVELLVEELAKAAAPLPTSTDAVLEADDGSILVDRFLVKRVLGHGASARVLLVEDEGGAGPSRVCALKVSRGEEHDDRVRAEGELLAGLEHPHIVRCLEAPMEIGGRTCLLLSFAGERNLAQLLGEVGSLDLEQAGRYGEDLLGALQELEEHGVLHRDIKPANLAVGSRNKLAKHLTLFDFSLVGAPVDQLEIGTAPWRDPFLPLRGAWDAAADRYSAAVVLHEILTGVRPRFGRPGSSPLDPSAALELAAERFDASIRDRLIAFFTQSLARESSERFESAEAMKRAWSACLATPARVDRPSAAAALREVDRPAAVEPEHPEDRRGTGVLPGAVSDAEIAAITPATPLRALPLSPRALNALDRAGLMTARDLLGLANNRLSAIRGIGTKVAQEILALRDRWRAHAQAGIEAGTETSTEAPALRPDFAGPDVYVEQLDLPDEVSRALLDAGLRTTAAIARAPRTQIDAVVSRVGHASNLVEAALGTGTDAETTEDPSSLEGWILRVAPPGRAARAQHLRWLLGLDGDAGGSLGEVAERRGVVRSTLEKAWIEAIGRWRSAPWAKALRGLVVAAVERSGGVATLEEAAAALATALGDDRIGTAVSSPAPQVHAGALVRVAAELGPADDGATLSLRRTPRSSIDPATGEVRVHARTWALTIDEAQWSTVKQLGAVADALAERPVLAASGETERLLAEAVVEPLPALPRTRLVELAALASARAAMSSRLELYPVGMPAARALELSAQALVGELNEATLRARVAARYPEAQPLPGRADGLDRLLEEAELGLRFVEESARYVRAGVSGATSLPQASAIDRQATVGPTMVSSERTRRAGDFEDALRSVVQERKLRVLAVNPAWQRHAIVDLERSLGVRAVAIDRLIAARMDAVIRARSSKPEVLDRADAAGPEGPRWSQLLTVAREAAEAVAKELLPPKQTLLLTQAGLVARYRLEAFVAQVVEAAQDDASAAIVLLNPVPVGNRPDVLAGTLPVPGLLPGQVTEIPREWLENRHRTGTMAAI
jgi:serine/threonine protein kinase